MEKKVLRKNIQQQLTALSSDTYNSNSTRIHEKFMTLPQFQQATVIGITISTFPEVETRQLIAQMWQLGKRVAVPRCKPKTREMDFYIINSFNELETVYMALLEPIPARTTAVLANDIDLMVVPGIVFDRQGYRIGYGGGYYDRYLPTFSGETVALCFSSQIVAKVPKDSYDYPIDRIVTEDEMIPCANIRKEEQHG